MEKDADCSSKNYTGVVFSPKTGEVYHPGDMMTISWYGGKPSIGTISDFMARLEPSVFEKAPISPFGGTDILPADLITGNSGTAYYR